MSVIINTPQELLEKMNNSDTFTKVVYGRYYRDSIKEQEEIDAANTAFPHNRKFWSYATKIQDGMFIIELHNYNSAHEVVYTPVVDGKKCDMVFTGFDKALLCAIAMRHGAEINGVKYAGMILGV